MANVPHLVEQRIDGKPNRLAEDSGIVSSGAVVLFLLSHVILAVIMQQSSLLATLHAFATLGLGVVFLALKEPENLIYLTGYIIGAELLWRGTGAAVFWEVGKYAIIALLIISLFRHQISRHANFLSAFYFILLLPSIALAINRSPHQLGPLGFIDLPFEVLRLDREAIAYNLSGPFVLAVATIYFSTVGFSRRQLRTLFVAMAAPTTGLLSIAIFGTLSLSQEQLAAIVASSKLTSAGIGPNQVSSILGLGMLVCFFLIFLVSNENKGLRVLFAMLCVAFAFQGMLTFSRGGFFTGLAAILVAAFYLAGNRQARSIILVGGPLLLLISVFLVFPMLDAATGDNLSERFTDTDLTDRDDLMTDELGIFRRNPLFGVGPGQAQYHGTYNKPAHTEYTRVLAEHGISGFLALVVLVIISIQRLLRRDTPLHKAVTLACTIWALLFFFHAATRLAAPAYIFGLASAALSLDSNNPSTYARAIDYQ